MKYLLPLILVLSLNSGCGTVNTLLGIKVPKSAEVKEGAGTVIDNLIPKSKAEKNIDLYLGIAAGLGALAIILGAIICIVQLLSGGNWKLGAGLWGGGIVGILGLQVVAVVLPWLKLIVIILLALIVVGTAGWLGYQLFILKRSFKQIVGGFQAVKDKEWTEDTKAEIAASYAPETQKLVATVKGQLETAQAKTRA